VSVSCAFHKKGVRRRSTSPPFNKRRLISNYIPLSNRPCCRLNHKAFPLKTATDGSNLCTNCQQKTWVPNFRTQFPGNGMSEFIPVFQSMDCFLFFIYLFIVFFIKDTTVFTYFLKQVLPIL